MNDDFYILRSSDFVLKTGKYLNRFSKILNQKIKNQIFHMMEEKNGCRLLRSIDFVYENNFFSNFVFIVLTNRSIRHK
jgi:hypothetical protein